MRKKDKKRWGSRALAMVLATLLCYTSSAAPLAVSAESNVIQINEEREESEISDIAAQPIKPVDGAQEPQIQEPQIQEQAQKDETVGDAQAPQTQEKTQTDEPEDIQQPSEAAEEPQIDEMAEESQVLAVSGTVQITDGNQLPNVIPAGSTYELANDITVGKMISKVEGILDGKGHTITLTSGRPLANKSTGTIQNLILTSTQPVRGQDNLTGSIVVYMAGGKLYNCLSTVRISGSMDSQMGGLAYRAEAGSEIRNCIFAGGYSATKGFGIARDASDISSPQKPSTFSNCYFDSSSATKAFGLGRQGRDYNIEEPVEGKSADDMKTQAFVDQLNKQQLGTGFVWEAVDGGLPRLVAGGGDVEHANLDKLKAAIQDAEGRNESDYTADSWAAMQEALKKAKDTAAAYGVTQDEVDAAETELKEALAALKEKVRSHLPVELPKEGITYISSAEEFKKTRFDTPGKFYQLTQDIEINQSFWSRNLAGVFDGGGHTITLNFQYDGCSLFDEILSSGVVQNLNVKVEGNYPNRYELAPYAQNLKGGLIVNCVSQVSGQHSTGFVMRMTEGGIMANCLTMGHNRRGAFVHFQKSTDHANTNGFSNGKFYNCYWAASNSVENILGVSGDSMFSSRAVGDDELRSDGFVAQLNQNKGDYGFRWGRNSEGYPYLGEDQGEHVIDGSKNLYPVEFVWNDGRTETVKDGRLDLSPQLTTGRDNFAGNFRLKDVPAGSTISWSCEDHADRGVIALFDNARLCVYQDGGAVVRATERKADGSEQLAAEIRVVSNSQKIEQIRLVLDGNVINDSVTVQGSSDNRLEIQAKYEGSDAYQPMPSYLVDLKSEKPEILHTMYNTAVFYFSEPGTAKLTVTPKHGGAPVTISVTSEYVPITSIVPGISGTHSIHGRNSMGSGQFNDIPLTVSVEPANASYKTKYEVISSDPEIAQFGGRAAYVPYKAGTVTFTAKADDQGTPVEGSSKVTFVYENPLVSVSAPEKPITAEVGNKVPLELKFVGKNSDYAAVSEPELVWTYSQTGIVSISRPDSLKQIRDTGTLDSGNWVASDQYVLKALKPGTVQVTGTPVDTTGGAQPVTFSVTVSGDEGDIQAFDIPAFIAQGKRTAAQHLISQNDYTFGQEWTIYALLRDGQQLPEDRLEQYYTSVAASVKSWKPDITATEIERVALALSIMDRDITDVDGVNLVDMICNHPNLPRQGSNALIWALIALDLKNTPIPDGAKWSRERMVTELLTYQKDNGGFGLDKKGGSSLDMTAMALQALSYYQNMSGVQEAIEKGIRYMAKAAEKNLDYGNAESVSQAILALSVLKRDLVEEPGFGDKVDNLMSVLALYLVKDQGFEHAKGQGVNTMATVQAMQALCAYERFTKGESGYWDLAGNRPNFDPVANVIQMIDRLPETITLEDIDAVREARKAYDALNPQQQARVTNLSKLLAAEEAVGNLSQDDKAALAVMDLISALPDTVTLKDASKVKQARSAYDALSQAQKDKVTNADKLFAAEKTLADLEAAQLVIDAIHKLPDPITADAQTAVEAARKAYDALTQQQQELVVNRYLLEKAEKELDDAIAVKKVTDAIDALPDTVKETDAYAIRAARAAYDQLPEELQARVGNLDKLRKAEKGLKALRKPSGKPGGAAQSESGNLVEAVVKNGKISADQLKDIQGKDMLLRMSGTMETGEAYTLTIYGKDIKKAAEVNTAMMRKGLYEDDIRKLSENPEIFRFVHTGAFPAPMLVQVESKLSDGEYLLMHFDPEQRKASLVTRAEVADGQVQFIVEEGGEYFLAKKASSKSLQEQKENEETVPFDQQITEPTEQTASQTAQQPEEGSRSFWYWAVPAVILVAGAAGFGVVAVRKGKGKNGE